MLNVLLSDPESKNYDIRKTLADSGVPDFEIIEEPDIKKAQERIKKEKPGFMIVCYAFNDADSGNAIRFIKENTVPSVLLIYPCEIGLVRECELKE